MLKASAIGNLGADPETRYSANGNPFMRFNIATNGRRKNESGEWYDYTEWLRVTVLGSRAETLGQYLHKGMRVYVDGRLEARPWTDQQGNIRAGLELIASEVQFASSRQDDEQRNGGGGNQQQRPQQQQQPAAAGAPRQGQGQQQTTRQKLDMDDPDADLPF